MLAVSEPMRKERSRLSELSYSQRPRLGPGWARASYGLAIVLLSAASVWSAARIVGGVRQASTGAGPLSAEERVLRDAYEAVQQDPKSAAARWQLSLALTTIGDFTKAREHAEQAVRLDSKMVEAYYALGIAYRGLEDFERAEKALSKAAALPGSVSDVYRDVYYDLGQVRLELKDNRGAVEAFEAALANGPEATYVVIALADSYRLVGDDKRAKAEYLAALGYDPTNEDIATTLRAMGVAETEIERARNPGAHQIEGE